MKQIPKASGGDRKSDSFKNSPHVDFDSQKPKSQVIKENGLTQRQAEHFQIMADNPDSVARAKEKARKDDDKVLKDLIETNIMQRGIGNTNPIKLAKCIVELERILGISHGGDRKSSLHNDNLTTQADLAEKLKVSQSQLSRYKKLLDLVPELQSAVEPGQISAKHPVHARGIRAFPNKLHLSHKCVSCNM